jgi:hypothetical protein
VEHEGVEVAALAQLEDQAHLQPIRAEVYAHAAGAMRVGWRCKTGTTKNISGYRFWNEFDEEKEFGQTFGPLLRSSIERIPE